MSVPSPPKPFDAPFKLTLSPDFQPATSAQKKLEAIKDRLVKTKQLTDVYTKRYQRLTEFNKMLTDSYLKNINVIIDISSLLTMYNGLFDKVLEILGQFDAQLVQDIKPETIAHIQQLTGDNIQKVVNYFQKDVHGLVGIMEKIGYNKMAENIRQASKTFIDTQKAAQTTMAEMQGGKKHDRKKLKIIKSKGRVRLAK